MGEVLTLTVSAVLLAGFYAAMAYGLGLIYGVLRIVNLAHGGIIMASAYLTWQLYTEFQVDPYLAIRFPGHTKEITQLGVTIAVLHRSCSDFRNAQTREPAGADHLGFERHLRRRMQDEFQAHDRSSSRESAIEYFPSLPP